MGGRDASRGLDIDLRFGMLTYVVLSTTKFVISTTPFLTITEDAGSDRCRLCRAVTMAVVLTIIGVKRKAAGGFYLSSPNAESASGSTS